MRYGSVASHGVDIVTSLLADDRYRLIYRPHPRTGVHEADFVSADARIRELISRANDSPEGLHFVDDSPFGWQLDIADVMITDISAVAYDWLTTAKPLLVTQPVEPEAVMPQEGFMSEIPLLESHEAMETAQIVDGLISDEDLKSHMKSWADYHYGDRARGSSLARFVNAIESVITERDASVAVRKAEDASFQFDGMSGADGVSARQHQRRLPSQAVQGLTFAHRSIDFATTGIANLTAQTRAETQIKGTIVSAMKDRTAEILVSTMAGPNDIASIIEWLPSLEKLNQRHSLALLTGNQRSYEKLLKSTSLRVYIGRSASETEELFTALQPTLHLQFEQANLNLRELTHRRVVHAYVGSDHDEDWINNRLRAFDIVFAGTTTCPDSIRNALIDFPEQTRVVSLPRNGNINELRAAAVADLLTKTGSI